MPRNNWIICPTCQGEGKHSRNLEAKGGGFTMTEFMETFDTPEDRADYFAGAYASSCNTCGGTGKIKEEDLHKHQEQVDRERGYNDEGEPL